MKIKTILALVAISLLMASCNSDTVKDAVDAVNGPDRKPIDKSKMAVNAFASDSRFGTPSQQFTEIKDKLGLTRVRLLFNWSDGVQSGPGAPLFLSFYDTLVKSLPAGVEADVVLTGVPSWMRDSANWVDGNPRETFVRDFVKPIFQRYASDGNIEAFEIWNEPNNPSFSENDTMQLTTSPENFVELTRLARVAGNKVGIPQRLVSGATTAINQNFPDTRDYNRAMRDASITSYVDVYGVHYYGKQYENVTRDGGVADFLNGLDKPIWVTESGAQGVNNQLAYGETTWPFLFDKITGIDRIYIYQFAEATPSGSTYGLKNLDEGASVSDLYVSLAAS